jgi:hypothetical protein
MFVPGKLFQPSLWVRSGAYPRVKHLFMAMISYNYCSKQPRTNATSRFYKVQYWKGEQKCHLVMTFCLPFQCCCFGFNIGLCESSLFHLFLTIKCENYLADTYKLHQFYLFKAVDWSLQRPRWAVKTDDDVQQSFAGVLGPFKQNL